MLNTKSICVHFFFTFWPVTWSWTSKSVEDESSSLPLCNWLLGTDSGSASELRLESKVMNRLDLSFATINLLRSIKSKLTLIQSYGRELWKDWKAETSEYFTNTELTSCHLIWRRPTHLDYDQTSCRHRMHTTPASEGERSRKIW